MRIRLVWTDSSLDHIAKHGVRRDEIEKALDGHQHIGSISGGCVVIAAARSRAYLIVLETVAAEPGLMVVVSARPAERSEKRLLRRRGKGSR